MRRQGAVQRKVPCLFVTEVKEEPSAKRQRQEMMTSLQFRTDEGERRDGWLYRKPFKVLATETLNEKALEADIYNAIPTEKVDGTCCYVTTYKGRPYLWARLDRRPNKQAEKRFKQFLYSLEDCKEFIWNFEEDFKPVPDTWIPAKEVEFSNGNPLPDENGHMPGWVPVEKNSKQYCWHSSVVNYEAEIALVLKHHADPGLLEISPVPLSELLEQTLELIGTNINANPYVPLTALFLVVQYKSSVSEEAMHVLTAWPKYQSPCVRKCARLSERKMLVCDMDCDSKHEEFHQ